MKSKYDWRRHEQELRTGGATLIEQEPVRGIHGTVHNQPTSRYVRDHIAVRPFTIFHLRDADGDALVVVPGEGAVAKDAATEFLSGFRGECPDARYVRRPYVVV
jgi:hypothetical protein